MEWMSSLRRSCLSFRISSSVFSSSSKCNGNWMTSLSVIVLCISKNWIHVSMVASRGPGHIPSSRQISSSNCWYASRIVRGACRIDWYKKNETKNTFNQFIAQILNNSIISYVIDIEWLLLLNRWWFRWNVFRICWIRRYAAAHLFVQPQQNNKISQN